MQMGEKPVPWWRKALQYVLGRIRSSLFPRPAQPETAKAPEPFVHQETDLEEAALTGKDTNPLSDPETVAAQVPVEAAPVAEPASEAELAPETDAEVAPAAEPDVEAAPDASVPAEPPAASAIEPAPVPEPVPAETALPPVAVEPASPQPILDEKAAADEKAAEAAKAAADEKTAAKLAARQKRLDEADEDSPFSVFVGQVYDGPLDLLLDLIRKQDIDIYDIPIAKITAQFLAYVNQLKAGDVDVAGEFIYTASLLIHIKSKMLLPRSPSGPDDAAEDPRRELVEQLLEHERFKNAAQMLQQKQMLEAATWTNPGFREFQGDAAAEPEIAADTVDLVRVFRDILERARNRPVLDVEEGSVTVGQMIQFLARRLTMEDKPVALHRLLSHTHSERALIAMFLALLELVRMQAILLRQDRQFSEIFIKKHTNFDSVMNQGLANAQDEWR
jgi:segregation and condensation protein A